MPALLCFDIRTEDGPKSRHHPATLLRFELRFQARAQPAILLRFPAEILSLSLSLVQN
ncbi:MAG: hypothetical protein V7604_3969 [Hyphomicrobiales bacterium]|jgi:hypothetical protein